MISSYEYKQLRRLLGKPKPIKSLNKGKEWRNGYPEYFDNELHIITTNRVFNAIAFIDIDDDIIHILFDPEQTNFTNINKVISVKKDCFKSERYFNNYFNYSIFENDFTFDQLCNQINEKSANKEIEIIIGIKGFGHNVLKHIFDQFRSKY